MKIEVNLPKIRHHAALRAAALSFAGIAAAVVLNSPTHAQSFLAAGADVKVTDVDMRAAAELIPLVTRAGLLTRSDVVEQQAKGIYLRRRIAQEAVRTGLDKDPVVDGLVALARERILSDAVLGALDAANAPGDAALESYAQAAYKADSGRFQAGPQVQARHILVRNTEPEAKEKVQNLLVQIKGGASFEAIARTQSDDITTSAKGGDLGFISPETTFKPFQAALSELKNPGDLSDVVETDVGYHLIKLEARRSSGIVPYAEVREALRAEARTRAQQEARAKKINELLKPFKAEPAAIEAFTQRYK